MGNSSKQSCITKCNLIRPSFDLYLNKGAIFLFDDAVNTMIIH